MNNSYKILIEHFTIYLQTLGFSSHTVKNYPQLLTHFLKYLQTQDVNQINKLSQTHLQAYITHIQLRTNMRVSGRTLSVAHLNKNFDALDKFLEFLHAQGLSNAPIPSNFRILQTRTEVYQKVKFFTKEEIQILYESTNNLFPRLTFKTQEPRQALAVLILDLCYGCGLRRSETFKLTIEDIDLDKKRIFIQQAKGNKDRFVPMSETITKRITVFIYQHRRQFSMTNNRVFPLKFDSLPYYFKILLKASNLKYDAGTGVHILRHSIATHLLQNGMSIEQIAKFLGHSTLESTQVYTHLIEENEQ